jgi:hypothetical protein
MRALRGGLSGIEFFSQRGNFILGSRAATARRLPPDLLQFCPRRAQFLLFFLPLRLCRFQARLQISGCRSLFLEIRVLCLQSFNLFLARRQSISRFRQVALCGLRASANHFLLQWALLSPPAPPSKYLSQKKENHPFCSQC